MSNWHECSKCGKPCDTYVTSNTLRGGGPERLSLCCQVPVRVRSGGK